MNGRFQTHTLVAVALAATLLTSTGCQTGPQTGGPIRAIWVTRYDYKTADDVSRIIDNCATAGFNTVLFQVRGNGTSFYKSAFEPWADELGGADPGFDPLALACREAHDRDVELHAWVNVMPAWRGKKPPANPEQLYNKHPDWFWYDQHGNRQALSSFYVSLNPCLPEVREYIVDVFQDLVANYDVDGLHMDYIRFPNEPPATPKGSGLDYSRDQATLDLYLAETGLTPDQDKEAWSRWRTDQVSKLVADIHAMMRHTKPKAALSAAVGSVRERALHHFQDGRQWIDEGIIDIVLLMNYTDSPDTFAGRIDPWMADDPAAPIVPGLWFGRHASVDAGIQAVKEQIAIAEEKTGNFCVFAYSSLFDSQDEELTAQDSKQRATRHSRREVLVPVIQEMAGIAE